MDAPVLPGVQIFEPLGEGGIAEVWRGEWRGEPVAVKVLRDRTRPNVVRRFLREGRMLQRLHHPNVVRCRAVMDLDPPALLLELLRGEPLDRRVRRSRLNPAEAERVALDVLRALDHVHQHGIVHRDVKASNVWVEPDGRARLLDLGLAADATDPLTNSLGDVIGTYAYMSPEHLAGLEVDVRSDLYSLGITLYEALSGRRPYQAANAAAYLAAHRSAQAPPLRAWVRDLPPRLEQLVRRLMAIDPARRPPDAGSAIRELLGQPLVGLRPPARVGRAALVGALTACFHQGGVLRVTGEPGSGIGATGRAAVELAAQEGFEHATLRVRRRMDPREGAGALARALEPITGSLAPHPAAVRRALCDLAGQDPGFVLVVEDADLAAEPLLEWIAGLAAVPGLRMVLTGARLPARPPGRTLTLRPLVREESRELLVSMLGTASLPPGLDAELHATSAGLPGVLVDLTRASVESGALVAGGDRWTWRRDRGVGLVRGEERLRERWRARLPPESWRPVELLALAGEDLPLSLLLRAAEADPSGIALGPPLRLGLLRAGERKGEETVGLRRPLLDRALTAGMPEAEVRAGHRALATAAVAETSGWSRRFRARHLALGAEGEGEGRLLVLLAARLLDEGEFGEVLRIADRALAVVDPADAPWAARLRVDALLVTGRASEAAAALVSARQIPGANPEDEELRRLAVECALATGTFPSARQLEGIEGLEGPRARLLHGRLRALRGDLLGALDELDAPELRRPRGVDAPSALGAALRAAWHSEIGQPEEAWTALAEVIPRVEEDPRPPLLALLLRERALLHLRAGRLARAGEDLDRAAPLAGEGTTGALPLRVAIARLHLARALGDPQARALAGVVVEEAPGLDWETRAERVQALVELRLEAGDAPAALAVLLPAVEAAGAAGDRVRHALLASLLALLTGEAERFAAETEALASMGAHRTLAWVLRHAARHGLAPELLASAEAQARQVDDRVLLLAVLDAARGPGAREEALQLVAAMAADLPPEARANLLTTRAARWARGEPGGGRRDGGR